MTKTIYIEKTVRETKGLVEVLDQAKRDRKAGEIVITARDRVQLEVAGFKPYVECKGFDLFFKELEAKRVIIVAKPIWRDAADRLADLITLGAFKTIA